jgi:hypothetical protein
MNCPRQTVATSAVFERAATGVEEITPVLTESF